MSAKTSAVSLSGEIREFISNQMLDVQKESTRVIEQYVKDLTRRISIVEHELGNENYPIVSSHSEPTDALLRSEATPFEKKNKPDGLKQQVLHLQVLLSDTNARIKDLEALFLRTNTSVLERFKSTDDRLKNLVKTELDAVLEEKVKSCVVKNFGKQLQEMSSDDSRNRDIQRGISQSSIISAWRRDKSHDESEEWKDPELDCVKSRAGQVPSDSDQEVMKSMQVKRGTLRGVGSGTKQPPSLESRIEEGSGDNTGMQHTVSTGILEQPKSLEGMLKEDPSENTLNGMRHTASTRTLEQPMSLEGRLQEDTDETTDRKMQHTVSTRTLDQPMSLEGRLEGGTSDNTNRGMQHTVSTRTLDQPMSLEGRLEGGTSDNTNRDMQHTVSTRTLDQPMSLEGRLEGGTSDNTPGEMQHTASTRTLVQPMSLEGRLEGDTGENTDREMQHTVSTRTLVQPMSLEGRLEGDPSENTREMQPASSTRNLEQPMSLEGRLEEDKAEAASETKPPIHQKSSAAKSKMFGLFYKKPKKSSKVPDTGGPDKP